MRHTPSSPAPIQFSVLRIVVTLMAIAIPSFVLQAAQPHVNFDAVTLIGCCDVTPEDFALVHPDERLVEAIFCISTFTARENYENMDLVIQIVSPNRSVQIIDHLPNTTTTSEYATNIAYDKGHEKVAGIGLNAGGTAAEVVNLTSNLNFSNKTTSSVRYEKLPPTQILAASGTLQRGSGVYFKLKPSSQTTLEGSREYAVKMRVPTTWRGDIMHLHCRARHFQKGGLFSDESIEPAGSADYLVALYLDFDQQAKQIAAALVDAELQLRTVANRHKAQIEDATADSKLVFVTVSKAKIPSDWLTQILFDPTPKSVPTFVKQLPEELRTAIIKLAVLKSQLLSLA